MGAFGAHGLRPHIPQDLFPVYQTGVQYHFYHALALLLTGCLALHMKESKTLEWAGAAFLTGILLFSCSLYALSLTGVRSIGMITPIGGTAFLLGWLLLAWTAYRSL